MAGQARGGGELSHQDWTVETSQCAIKGCENQESVTSVDQTLDITYHNNSSSQNYFEVSPNFPSLVCIRRLKGRAKDVYFPLSVAQGFYDNDLSN